jgi:hypothetical protein
MMMWLEADDLFTVDGDVVEPRRTIQQNALNVENLTLEPKK